MRYGVSLALSLGALSGCGGPEDETIDGVVLPNIESVGFSAQVSHTRMHLLPGNLWKYERQTANGVELTTVTVPEEQKSFPEVSGATIVKSSVTLGETKVRDSTDYYAMDTHGSVWHFGKEECEYQGSSCVPTARSWMWTGGDARPGIVIYGDPQPNTPPYYEVFYQGEVEEVNEVLAAGDDLTVPAQAFPYHDCVTVRHTSKIDTSVDVLHHYCQIVGLTLVEDGDSKTELTFFQGI